MTWTNFPCVGKWTLTDNEATEFDVLEAGGVFLLSIDTHPLFYGTVINPLTATSFTAKLYSDEAKATEIVTGSYTGLSYILSRFSAWRWSPLLFDGALDPNGIGTYRSNPVQLYVSGGRLDGEWVAILNLGGIVEIRFKGTFTPFALAVIGLTGQAFTDTGTLAPGTYTYFVSAVNAGGFEGGASWIDVTLPATGRVVLNWLPTPGAVSYRVYRNCELLESGIGDETIEDDGGAVEDPGDTPNPEPDPDIPPPDDPPVDIDPGDTDDDPVVIIIDDDTNGEDDIVAIDTPGVEITDDGNDCENTIYQDLNGNDVVITSLGGRPVTFERLGSGRWAEENSILAVPVSIEDLYVIDGLIVPPDYSTIVGPPVTWADLLTDNTVTGVYRISLNESAGITYPCDVAIDVVSNNFTLNDAVLTVHYNTGPATIATSAVGDDETSLTVSVPHVFGVRAIEKQLAGGYQNILDLPEWTFTDSFNVTAVYPNIQINTGGYFEVDSSGLIFPLNLRASYINNPGASVEQRGFFFKNIGGLPDFTFFPGDPAEEFTVTAATIPDRVNLDQPLSTGVVEILIESQIPVATSQVEFSINLAGTIFNLDVRDSTGADRLIAPCITVNYVDTYIPPGQNPVGTRQEEIVLNEQETARIAAIQATIGAIRNAIFNPVSQGYGDITPDRIGSSTSAAKKRKKTRRGGDTPPVPEISMPFFERTTIQQSRDNLGVQTTRTVPKPLGDVIKSGLV